MSLFAKEDKNRTLVEEFFLKLHANLKLCNMTELKMHTKVRDDLLSRGEVALYIFRATDKQAPEDPKLNFPYTFSYHALTFNPVTLAIMEVKIFRHDEIKLALNYLDEFYGIKEQ